MSLDELLVVVGGLLAIAFVNVYFLGGGRLRRGPGSRGEDASRERRMP